VVLTVGIGLPMDPARRNIQRLAFVRGYGGLSFILRIRSLIAPFSPQESDISRRKSTRAAVIFSIISRVRQFRVFHPLIGFHAISVSPALSTRTGHSLLPTIPERLIQVER